MLKKLFRLLRKTPDQRGHEEKPTHLPQRVRDVAELERRVLDAIAKGETIPKSVLNRILGKDD